MVQLARSLKRNGHEVTVLTGYHPQVPPETFAGIADEGIDFYRMNLPKLSFTPRTLRNIVKLRRWLKERDFDIVHAHKGMTTNYVFLASLGLTVPIVSNRGVTDPLVFYSAFKYRMNKIDRIVAVSRAVKEVMVQSGRIDPGKIEVIYGGVDVHRFSPDVPGVLHGELGISEGRFTWGFVGNSGERKGLRYLLEGFASYLEKYPDDLLILVGVYPEDEPVKPYLKRLPGSIHAVGFRTDVHRCLASFDAFVFTGIFKEGLTGTVREAGAMRLPIVCTDVGGNGELISDGQTGLLIPVRNGRAVARAMEKIRRNRSLAEKLAGNVRSFVERNMSDEVRCERMTKLYLRVLEERRKATSG